MKKKIIIVSLVAITCTILFNIQKEDKKDNYNNIGIILETSKGNINADTFPKKEEYEYDKITCENLNGETTATPTFNTDSWKLDLNLQTDDKIDGQFECTIYFKEKKKEIKPGAETIISKYSATNTEGLIKLDQPATDQTKATTEYRYSGKRGECYYVGFEDNPSNYSYTSFYENCIDSVNRCISADSTTILGYTTESTCKSNGGKWQNVELEWREGEVKNYVRFNDEIWRIIGVFEVDNGSGTYEQRIKIIRNSYIGTYYSWDSYATSFLSGYGITQWGPCKNATEGVADYEGADIMRLLNPGYTGINGSLYWNSQSGKCYSDKGNSSTSCDFTTSGLKAEAQNMIDDAKWYTAAATVENQTVLDLYKQERGSGVGTSNGWIKTTSWVGKVALKYPSDFGYALSYCYNSEKPLTDAQSRIECLRTNWMFHDYVDWTITPKLSSPNETLYIIGSAGSYTNYVQYKYSSSRHFVIPTVYLKKEVKITGGTGKASDPYELSLED